MKLSKSDFSNSDLIVLFVLGKRGRLSGDKIYKASKKDPLLREDCSGRRPESPSSIYRSIRKLVEKGYLEEVGERRVKGTLERFYSLSKQGQEIYPGIRDQFHILEFVPDFDAMSRACLKCEASIVEDCWKEYHASFNAIAKTVPLPTLKEHFRTPNDLAEFTYWLNMLSVPKKRLTEKFESQIRVLGLEYLLTSM